MHKASERDRQTWVVLGFIGVVLLGAIIYSNILNAPFVFDDHSSIKENDSIRSIAESLKKISSNRYLVLFSFAFNYAVGGLKPFGYHLINNLIHVINALLVYYLVILTFRTPYFSYQPSANSYQQSSYSPIHRFTHSPSFIAFSAAFIFIASHPIQTQAVTYIAQRATSMAAMFYLLSLVMYIKWRLIYSASRAAEQQSNRKDLKTTALLAYCATASTVLLLYCASLFALCRSCHENKRDSVHFACCHCSFMNSLFQ